MFKTIRVLTLTALLPIISFPSFVWADSIPLMELYQYFHANPELSFQEVETSKMLAQELESLGFVVTRGVGGAEVREQLQKRGSVLNPKVGGHGVVGVFENGPGPVVLVRTDTDGLPVDEQTGLGYASRVRGQELTGQEVSVMHACGHDTHMTVFVGAARKLVAAREQWSGTLVFIGQPAEERGAGARMMLEDGLFERFPRPDYNLALHVSPTLPAGSVGYRAGWIFANVDSVDIRIHGVGAHGAYPQAGKDPIVLAAAIITSLQTLVSREVSPLEPAVVTVGSIHAGTKHNIISDRADLQLTVRSYSEEVRQKLLQGIERIAVNQARALGFPEDKLPEVVNGNEGTPSLWNDPQLVERNVAVLQEALGRENVLATEKVMGGEDFARYGRVDPAIPSHMLRLGSLAPMRYQAYIAGGEIPPSLHSPFYTPVADVTIETGVEAMTAMVLDLLSSTP
jgi:amidohydrolase